MFASQNLLIHLSRGVVGLGSFAGSMVLNPTHPLFSLALIPFGLVALRGCPMCWTIGLFETVAAKIAGRSAPNACVDGRCALKKPADLTCESS
jgi:hypothetical protein